MRDSTEADRHCLVTGANRGLGLEFVRQLLVRGERVVAACRHPGRATALNLLAGDHPGRLHVLPLDVASARSRDELVRELPLVLDGARLGLLVNNAGVLHGGERFGQVADMLVTVFDQPVRQAGLGGDPFAQLTRVRDALPGAGNLAACQQVQRPCRVAWRRIAEVADQCRAFVERRGAAIECPVERGEAAHQSSSP